MRDLKYDFNFHCCKPERVLLHQQRREQTACTCVCVPERWCVISAHFRVHSTHLPCDRGKWEVALTDMERCILGLRDRCAERLQEIHTTVSQPRLSFVEGWRTSQLKYCRANIKMQVKASPHTHTQTHLLVWRAKGVSGKCCKITTKMSRANAWMNL